MNVSIGTRLLGSGSIFRDHSSGNDVSVFLKNESSKLWDFREKFHYDRPIGLYDDLSDFRLAEGGCILFDKFRGG